MKHSNTDPLSQDTAMPGPTASAVLHVKGKDGALVARAWLAAFAPRSPRNDAGSLAPGAAGE